MKSRTLSVVLAALLLVGGLNIAAYAATGGKFLLGSKNVASKTTKLKNTGKGPALALKNKSSFPPLSISSSKKVVKLNADLIDGIDSSALGTTAYRYRLAPQGSVTQVAVEFPTLPKGIYQVQYSVIAIMDVPGSQMVCIGVDTTAGTFTNAAYSTIYTDVNITNGGGIVDARSDAFALECLSPDSNFSLSAAVPSEVTFVRIDRLNSGTPTPAAKRAPKLASHLTN